MHNPILKNVYRNGVDQFYEFWLQYYQIYPKSYCTITYSDQNLDPSKVQILDHFEDSISKKSNLFWHLKIGQKRSFYFLKLAKMAKIKIWKINQNWNWLKLHFCPFGLFLQ